MKRPAAPAAGPWRRSGRLIARLGPAGPLALAALVLPLAGGAALSYWVHRDPTVAERLRASVWGPAACAAASALVGGFALLPIAILALFAGWVFGFARGYVTVLAGLTGATLIAYSVARRSAGQRVVDVLDENPRWRAVHRALLHSGPVRTFLIVALLRLPTFPPFAATTVALAAMRVRWWPFVFGTISGIAPRTAVYVYLAAKAGRLDADEESSVWIFVISCVALLAAIGVLTIIARRALASLTAQE